MEVSAGLVVLVEGAEDEDEKSDAVDGPDAEAKDDVEEEAEAVAVERDASSCEYIRLKSKSSSLPGSGKMMDVV